MNKARLHEKYENQIRSTLQKELGLDNIMQVPRLEKIVINVGVKEAVSDSRIVQKVADVITAIAGQAAVKTKAKKSIAGFKLREGMPLGAMVTLRRKKMYEFLDILINLALPKVRDFQGVTRRLDGRGNYNLGLREWNVFPQAEKASLEMIHGLNITFHTSTDNDGHAFELLKSFGMPFKKTNK